MARERYLINAGEDTIHSNEIKLVTAKDKRENWWYYHKRQIIPAILVVALLAVFIHSMATKVDPDYTIGLLYHAGNRRAAAEGMYCRLC